KNPRLRGKSCRPSWPGEARRRRPSPAMEPTPARSNRTAKLAFSLLGAFAGGLVGHFAFLWIARHGFYALALPGALAGLGCGLVSKQNRLPVCFSCGGWALVLGIFSEWRLAPFSNDASLG